MSEGTLSPPEFHYKPPRRKAALVLAVTAVAVLIAGVLFQVFRGDTQPSKVKAAENQDPGRVVLGNSGRNARPLARVNNQQIPWELVAEECMARHGKEVLENIINRTIIQQACTESNIVVTEAEVEAEIVKIAKRFDLDRENWFQMLQIERNLTPRQYRRDIIWPMLSLKKIAGENVTVTKEDMRRVFLRDYGPKVKAKMIMMDNLRRAQEVWAQAVKDPEQFGKLARKHSVEPNSRALDGSIPPIKRYSGNDELEKKAFELRMGEVSGIIEVARKRYVILKCEGRTEQIFTFEEVNETLHEQIMEEKIQAAVARVFDKLKQEARVDNFITNRSTVGIRPTAGTRPGRSPKTTSRTAQSRQFPQPSGRPSKRTQ